jgi:Arc/MetJ family transcription regulator
LKTNVVIDDDLMESVPRVSGINTKKAAIEEAVGCIFKEIRDKLGIRAIGRTGPTSIPDGCR